MDRPVKPGDDGGGWGDDTESVDAATPTVVVPRHSRPKVGVASLAHSRPKDGVASLAHSRPKDGVASLAYGRGIQSALELHPQRTNTVIQIIFEPLLKPCTDGMLARVRASSRGVLVDG